ncbi:alpha/beta hydrolase [Gillisia sp. M10.2A]|uniref:Alpha/beta hydrolase n=1 Tax=Gillisia lutea TaxID=2909668 RepID=A0ABS9EFD6_9FLAO|nr:alpha/beta hydrolase [Gillisia lutea]MCF4100500.1 alpha/beta hydrolase [Gillisia lutea]
MTITYKNTPVFYSTKGTGNPLVLLHGFLESHKIWLPFTDKLSSERQVILIDLPGHGQSGTLSDVHNMELMAEVVREVLNNIGISEASIAGHSMGGYVSLAFYEKFPTMVKALALINSTSEEDSEERKFNRDRAISLVQKNKRSFVSMAISNLLTKKNDQKFKGELNILKEEGQKLTENSITAALKGMKIRTNKTELLAQFKGQKIIVAGQKDPVMSFNSVKRVAKKTNSTLKTFPDGHLSFIENEADLLEIMLLID